MAQFAPDLVEFGDFPGYGEWSIGHAREHIQFMRIIGGIPDYPLLSFLTEPSQDSIGQHSTAHDLLRSATGVGGIDLGGLDLKEGQGFQDWLNFHRQEHAQIRAVLGLT
jgi:hypothetical protein